MRPILIAGLVVLASACLNNRSYPEYQPPPDEPTPQASAGRLMGRLEVPQVLGASAANVVEDAQRRVILEKTRTLASGAKQLRTPVEPAPAPVGELVAGELVARFEEANVSPEEALRVLESEGVRCEHGGYASPFHHLLRCRPEAGGALDDGATLELIQTLNGRPGVRYLEPNLIQRAFAVPNDTYYGEQWHYRMMNLEPAWDLSQGSPSVIVAVIDTGILAHPELTPNVVPGIDLISDPSSAGDGNARDNDPTDPGGDLPNGGSSWHGTHVAGTIAAVSNNGAGVAGVAWKSKVLPVRVLGEGGGTVFDIAAGIYWAAGVDVPGVRQNTTPAKVLNLSLGGPSAPLETYQEAIDAAVARGAVVVVAAGNEDVDATNTAPCNQQNVICVGATGLSGWVTQYSNYGAPVDVMAPGGDLGVDRDGDGYKDGVLSTYANQSGAPNFDFLQGTSMAAPHIAGLAALMGAMSPGITHSQVEAALKTSANPAFKCSIGCGAGLVDAYAALVAVKGEGSTTAARLSVAATSIVIRPSEEVSLAVSNTGGQPLQVTASLTGASASRISFIGGSVKDVGAGASTAFRLLANGTGLAEGDYPLTLQLSSNGGDVSVVVTIRVQRAQQARPAIVAAVYQDGAGEWQVGDARLSDPADGHAWLLEVEGGTYFILATVDLDGDENYFEDTEPLGFYRSLDDPVEVTVKQGQTITGLNFDLVPQESLGTP